MTEQFRIIHHRRHPHLFLPILLTPNPAILPAFEPPIPPLPHLPKQIPQGKLKRHLDFVLAAELAGDERVVRVVGALGAGAVEQDFWDFEVLGAFEVEFEEAEVGVFVVGGGEEGDEDCAADVCVHAGGFGEGEEVRGGGVCGDVVGGACCCCCC